MTLTNVRFWGNADSDQPLLTNLMSRRPGLALAGAYRGGDPRHRKMDSDAPGEVNTIRHFVFFIPFERAQATKVDEHRAGYLGGSPYRGLRHCTRRLPSISHRSRSQGSQRQY